MPIVTIKPTGGGVNKDLPPNELGPEQWSDSVNMRFINGLAETRRGIRAGWTTPLIVPYVVATFTTPTNRFIVQAGLTNVYVDNGTTQSEITRFTDGVAIASITFVGTTATLTTASAHGRSTGNTVSVFEAFEAAYNGIFTITVTSPTVFTYTMLSTPGANASAVGQYSYNVQANFTGTADDQWSLIPFNGILILNHPVDGPYYWNGDVTTRMRRLPGWAAGETAYAMRAFKNFLIAVAPKLGGVFYPHNIRWSESAEPGAIPTTWTASSTNDAGDTPQAAESSGQLIDGAALGDTFIVYGTDARYAMDYIGGNDVFRVYRLPGGDGILARGCVVATPKGHVFLSNGDVKLHAGGEATSIAEGTVRRYLFSLIDSTYAGRAFLALNPVVNEVWVVFPSTNQSVPNTVIAWNWNDNTRGIFTIPPTTCGCTGLIAVGVGSLAWSADPDTWVQDSSAWGFNEYSQNESRLILGHTAPALGLADTGNTDLGTAFTWSITKLGTTLGDNDAMKTISRSRPQGRGNNGVVLSIYHATTKLANDNISWPAAFAYTIGTSNWVNKFSKAGRFAGVQITGTDFYQLRSYDLDVTEGGKF